nr:hypothetical protein [Akkermansiaceae bacterium]
MVPAGAGAFGLALWLQAGSGQSAVAEPVAAGEESSRGAASKEYKEVIEPLLQDFCFD